MKHKIFPRAVAYAGCAILALTTTALAQNSDPKDTTVQVRHDAKDSKAPPITQEKETCWNWTSDIGYVSEYNFRGTNLTPGADGAGFIDVEVSRWNFTFGIYGIHQFGTARANTFAMGEGGGSGAAAGGFAEVPNPTYETPFPVGPPLLNVSGVVTPETTQNEFNEIDVFLQYRFALGPIDVTVGNIGFFIQRDAHTSLTFTNLVVRTPGLPFTGMPLPDQFLTPFGTVGDEQFDRIYIRLSTSKIPHFQPQVTYYQTVYSEGQDDFIIPRGPVVVGGVVIPTQVIKGGERNNDLGGYLDIRLRGNFHITDRVDFDPYAFITYSIDDRSEPIANPSNEQEILRGRSLVGFNNAQVGLELPIRLLHAARHSSGPCAPADVNLYFVPFGAYSYHISEPTPGTDRNEVFGGAKLTLTF